MNFARQKNNVINSKNNISEGNNKQYYLVQEHTLEKLTYVDVLALSHDNQYILMVLSQQSKQVCKLHRIHSQNPSQSLRTDYTSDYENIFDADFLNNNNNLFLMSIRGKYCFLDMFTISNNSWNALKRIYTGDYFKFILSHDDNLLYIFQKKLFSVWKRKDNYEQKSPDYQKNYERSTQIEYCGGINLSKTGNQIALFSSDQKLYLFSKRAYKWTIQFINYFGITHYSQYVAFCNDDLIVSPGWLIGWNHWKKKTIRSVQIQKDLRFNGKQQCSFLHDIYSQTLNIYQLKEFKTVLFQQINVKIYFNWIKVSENGEILIIIEDKVSIFQLQCLKS